MLVVRLQNYTREIVETDYRKQHLREELDVKTMFENYFEINKRLKM